MFRRFLRPTLILLLLLLLSFTLSSVRYESRSGVAPPMQPFRQRLKAHENIDAKMNRNSSKDSAACTAKHWSDMAASTGDRIVIATNMRSGSSFIGELLKSDPDTFYSFEPLMLTERAALEKRQLCDKNKLPALLDLVFQCRTTRLEFCSPGKWWLDKAFGRASNSSYDRGAQQCRSKKHKAAKIIRYHKLRQLAAAVTTRDGFVLYLARDPRGIMTSRKKIYEMRGPNWTALLDYDTFELCSDFAKNLKYLLGKFEDDEEVCRKRVVVLRYEDFAYSPKEMARKLYEFLGRKMHSKVVTYIQQHTLAEMPRSSNKTSRAFLFSTRRDSGQTAEAWRDKISWEQLQYIQNTCSSAMQILGYTAVHNESLLRNRSVSLVTSLHTELPQL